jgi:multidrug efflux pump subunit AcrB
MSLLIVVMGVLGIVSMPVDIFPVIDIPVATVIWTYTGLPPEEMERRVATPYERGTTTTVNDVARIESQSLPGYSVIRVYFHPEAKIELAIAQLTAIAQSIARVMPPGIVPGQVVKYNAATVPILQLAMSSRSLGESQMFDLGQNVVRTQLATVQGASLPLPYGGKPRQVMVDLDPESMYATGISPAEVSQAINRQNVILPTGTVKMGSLEYAVRLNSSPDATAEINEMPIRVVNGNMVYVKDVANVRDGFTVQTNVVRQDGARGVLLTVLKSGRDSTLDIIDRVQKQLTQIQKLSMPEGVTIKRLFDQSLFVRASIDNVLHEGAIAAVLTALMILLFLGSARSTVIVCISIPLSILTSISILGLLGQTINVMTLGGLALAVGILVDDATVEIENIHRNIGQGKPLLRAILDGAEQIAVPTLVSTLSICIVFVPVVFLTGTAKYLFTPLAMAVVFAMMANFLLPAELHLHRNHGDGVRGGWIWRAHRAFDGLFEWLRGGYKAMLDWALHHRLVTAGLFGLLAVVSLAMIPLVGRDFFPSVDAGQFRLHVRAASGARIEETEALFARVEARIRQIIPREEIDTILDNIGLPYLGVNFAYSDNASIGQMDGEILVALNREGHRPTGEYVRELREVLPREFPEATFFFQAADMVSQILNFGLPAPIDVQIQGRNPKVAYELARRIEAGMKKVPGAVDVHVHQVPSYPEIQIDVDREKAQMLGRSQREVAADVLTSLSGSSQTAPNFWLNPVNGVAYFIAVQTPPHVLDSMDAVKRIPLSTSAGRGQLLGNLADFKRGSGFAVVNHYNVQPVYDVYANVQGRDLGGVADDVVKLLGGIKVPDRFVVSMRGQVETMNASFRRLGLGLLFAILLVYLLMVVNFQSWLDPFIILMALPGALSGVIWMRLCRRRRSAYRL